MDDMEVVLEEFETLDHTAGNAAKDTLRDTGTLEFVETASIHILHTIIDARFDKEGAIKLDDFRGNGSMKNLKLHHDTFEFGMVKLETDFLGKVRRDR